MAKNKWMTAMMKLDGAVTDRTNPHNNVLQSPSPSVNFSFGKGWGLPLGYGLCLWGPPKSGKSLLCNAMVGQMHKDYPDGIVVKFDTERRDVAQMTSEQAKLFGVDMERYMVFAGNAPSMVFDKIEKDVRSMCQDGAPIKMIIIDSINGIRGRRSMNATTIDTQQIGDHALTIKDGMMRIVDTVREFKIGLVVTTHIAAELDQTEIMRGNKTKMAAAFGLQHGIEYFMYVEQNRSKEGKTDILGKDFIDEEKGDMMDKGEKTAHKIRTIMKDSSLGPKGRTAEFTLDYNHGIINIHEEVFKLGVNRGVIKKPNAMSYEFGDRKWVGKASMIDALKLDTDMQKAVLKELKLRDQAISLDEVAEAKLQETIIEE